MESPVNKSTSTCERGSFAEACAAAHLLAGGYGIIERNFRWKGGEVDLVARAPDANTVVFVEVRSTSRNSSSFLRTSLSPAKRRRLINTIALYRQKRAWARRAPVRFDVIWVEGGRIEHWKNVDLV